ncbi:MAG: ATP-binding protein [Thermofilaceae archaeon]
MKVRFADREVEFVDREVALKQFEELAEKGTRFPIVVYGPEGCGKSALLKQAIEVLREHGYSVAYVSPLVDKERDRLLYTEDLVDVVKEVLGEVVSRFPDPFNSARALITIAVETLYRAVEKGRNKKIAILADDVFQAIGLDKAELLVKQFLNMIEWPSIKYDKIVIVVASSEGITWERVGRHSWAKIRTIWNMPREGFKQLYDAMPEPKPPFEEVWKWTGGNPRYLEELYKAGWDVEGLLKEFVKSRGLVGKLAGLGDAAREVLKKALEDPDALFHSIRDVPGLVEKLTEWNLITYVYDKDQRLWIDTPPPEKDVEMGVGIYYAWQTPLHREAVRKALGA